MLRPRDLVIQFRNTIQGTWCTQGMHPLKLILSVSLLCHVHTVLILNLTAFSDPPRGTVIQPVPPVVLSQSVDLMCTATGESSITYTWVLMGEENTRLNSDPTSGNFTLTITQVNQYGLYICITTNNLGTDAANIIIIQASKYIHKQWTNCIGCMYLPKLSNITKIHTGNDQLPSEFCALNIGTVQLLHLTAHLVFILYNTTRCPIASG